MNVEQSPVTGREPKEQLTPQMRALAEFYDYSYHEAGDVFYRCMTGWRARMCLPRAIDDAHRA